jgi:uncharacterized protein YdhG (YjbR/CyaY superfamily)
MATIEEYIAGEPKQLQPRLEALRALLGEVLPRASQALKWNDLAFVHPDGVIVMMLSVHTNHINVVVTPSSLAAKAGDLGDYKPGKGTVQIPHNQPISRELITALLAYRLPEFERDGVKWM